MAERDARRPVADHVRRRVRRLLHVPLLALLIGLGLTPHFMLLPRLPGGPQTHDPTWLVVAPWVGTALLCGLAGLIDGAARPLYRAAALVFGASLLSVPALRLALLSDLPFPHGLAMWLKLDGESAMEADLYEIWLMSWLVCLGLIVLVRHILEWTLPVRHAGAVASVGTKATEPRSRSRAGPRKWPAHFRAGRSGP